MTDRFLNDYYDKHRDTYVSLAKVCTSVPEILLKIEIYGKKWTQWDWALLFSCIIEQMFYNAIFHSDCRNSTALYSDIIETIDNSADLDKIMTNKQIILNMICVINSRTKFMTRSLKTELCTLLAHVFKKFPALWNMSWMYAKYKNEAQKRWQKYHRLRTSVYTHVVADTNPYYKSNQYYHDFMKLYLCRKNNEDETED